MVQLLADILRVQGSYRTYEEWKHAVPGVSSVTERGSYRTYEEWKRFCLKCDRQIKDRSYRTYEEWKQLYNNKIIIDTITVLTVPMRNGNIEEVLL